ncbi:hypothetical protein [Flavobacterium sp.]|uniref:hypothetical protein n=1 Tax=Flavobacterium sp. TaxID=239 RepID=UPI002B4B9196|nr:hypothetical protein [Flavobacterium sp.]HLF52333.1 hypothetical protein [Flavobacterium sp.]
MAVLLKQYKDINDTLKHIKIQIIDGIDYAINDCPEFKNPEQLFNWLMDRVKYKNDPSQKELLQTLPTLLENNFHGNSGKGDCDCFTIATITLMIAQGWDNINIILAGRSKKCPVHIYTMIEWNGKRIVLDLTNKRYNVERYYPLTQKIPVRWKNWDA